MHADSNLNASLHPSMIILCEGFSVYFSVIFHFEQTKLSLGGVNVNSSPAHNCGKWQDALNQH